MPRLILPTVALALALAAPSGAAEKVSERDRFEMWNGCRSMDLIVETLPKAATDIGLTEKAVTVAARSRLRAARLYDDDASATLWISVNAAGLVAYGINVGFFKWVRDEATDTTDLAMTWFTGSTGMSGRNSSHILSSVTGHVDEFLDEYLRVNADACRKSN